MKIISRAFMYLALAGFTVSFIIHICGYIGIGDLFGIHPIQLHSLLPVVYVPAILACIKLHYDRPKETILVSALQGCPQWMKTLLLVIFGYALFSFIGLNLLEHNNIFTTDTYVSASRPLLVFYYIAFAMLYSFNSVLSHHSTLNCKNGHPLAPGETHCLLCDDKTT
ncbi:hypothetical protein [Kangiella sp. M94]